MKSSIKHGGIVRCDMVLVDAEDNWRDECDETFVSYSVASIVREQAKNANWARPKAGRVKWPGTPPCANAKKVDLCPKHSELIITDEEFRKFKADAKAKRKAERDELKKVIAKDKREAKAANALRAWPPRPRARRKTAKTT